MGATYLDDLRSEVNERQQDLNGTLVAIEKYADGKSKTAKYLRVSVIVLGALVGTRGVADKVGSDDGRFVAVAYAIVGVLIAAIGGIEAAFAYEKKSAEARRLAATCNAQILEIDCKLPEDQDAPIAEKLASTETLLTQQNEALKEIQAKAAEIGINVTRKVRKYRK